MEIVKNTDKELKQLRQDLSEEANEEARAEILDDIAVLKGRKKEAK